MGCSHRIKVKLVTGLNISIMDVLLKDSAQAVLINFPKWSASLKLVKALRKYYA